MSHTKKIQDYSIIFRSFFLIFLGAGIIILVANKHPFLLANSKISQENQNQEITSLMPLKIYIPKISKVLDVSEGQIEDNRWTVSPNGVSYLTSSSLPGTFGNSVIYGHNKKEILGNLPKVESGDTIYVVVANGNIVKYNVFETKQISKKQVEILNQSPDPRLTVYTCSGFLDQSRFVVIAKQVETSI